MGIDSDRKVNVPRHSTLLVCSQRLRPATQARLSITTSCALRRTSLGNVLFYHAEQLL
jgi:hypothetical protein